MQTSQAKYQLLAISNSEESFFFLNENVGNPGVVFFNKTLQPILSSHEVGCPKVARSFVADLDKNKTYPEDAKSLSFHSLDSLISKIKIISGDSIAFKQALSAKDFDYVAVYGWSKMLPDQSATMMQIGDEATVNKKAKILIISLNLDYSKEWWGDKKINVQL